MRLPLYLIAALLTMCSSACFRQHPRYFVPVFFEPVAGASGSTWSSELRLKNVGRTDHRVDLRHFPYAGVNCSVDSVLLRSGEEQVFRSLGCLPIRSPESPRLTAVEIFSGPEVTVTARILRTAAGETRTMAMTNLPASPALFTHRSRLHLSTAAGRHSLGLVNPNSAAMSISLQRSDSSTARHLFLPAGSSTLLFDFLAGASAEKVELTASSEGAFYLYDSEVTAETGLLRLTPGDAVD